MTKRFLTPFPHVADAHARGLWVNAASEPAQGDFFLPATIRRGDFVLAVSTSGAAPILTQTVRDQLETQFDDTFSVWVALLAELCPLVMQRIADTEQRQHVLTSLCQWTWLARLRRENVDAVRAAMYGEIDALAGKRDS